MRGRHGDLREAADARVCAAVKPFGDLAVWRASFDRQVSGIEIGITWTRPRPTAVPHVAQIGARNLPLSGANNGAPKHA